MVWWYERNTFNVCKCYLKCFCRDFFVLRFQVRQLCYFLVSQSHYQSTFYEYFYFYFKFAVVYVILLTLKNSCKDHLKMGRAILTWLFYLARDLNAWLFIGLQVCWSMFWIHESLIKSADATLLIWNAICLIFYVRQQVPECPVDRERLDPEKVIYFSVALRAGVQAKQGINLLAYQHDVSIAIFLSHSRHL